MGASNGAAGRASASMMAKFAAFAVDINGTALARYDLTATEKESAEQEARQYLERHQVVVREQGSKRLSWSLFFGFGGV